jgi:hypothetical protein
MDLDCQELKDLWALAERRSLKGQDNMDDPQLREAFDNTRELLWAFQAWLEQKESGESCSLAGFSPFYCLLIPA